MEDLTGLMSILDNISKSFPEGEYLKACNHMKNLYKVVPRQTSPEVFAPRIRTPRRLLDSDSESEDDNDDFLIIERPNQQRQELAEIGSIIYRYDQEIRRIESRLRYLKPKQRITASVRRDAVRERAQQLGVRLRQYTVEELRAKGHHLPNERSFYKSYLDRQNIITNDLIADLRGDLMDLNAARTTSLNRRDELQTLFFGAPLQ